MYNSIQIPPISHLSQTHINNITNSQPKMQSNCTLKSKNQNPNFKTTILQQILVLQKQMGLKYHEYKYIHTHIYIHKAKKGILLAINTTKQSNSKTIQNPLIKIQSFSKRTSTNGISNLKFARFEKSQPR